MDPLEAQLWVATKQRHARLLDTVHHMRVRQKRQIFALLRSHPAASPDLFLPELGLHCGEFACCHLLSERSRKEARRVWEAELASSTSSSAPMALG